MSKIGSEGGRAEVRESGGSEGERSKGEREGGRAEVSESGSEGERE